MNAGSMSLIIVALLLASSMKAPAVDDTLDGCEPPQNIERLLIQVSDDEADWTLSELISAWPHTLLTTGWTTRGVPSIFTYYGRVIDGQCECCETVEFDDVDARGDDSPLRTVQIHYTIAGSQSDALAFGRLLVDVLDFPNENEALEAPYWTSGDGTWRWQSVGAVEVESASVDLRRPKEGLWTVGFRFSRTPR